MKTRNRFWTMTAKAEGEADIMIHEEIGLDWFSGDGMTSKKFAQDLKALGEDIRHIDLSINSPGGNVFDGIAIYNMLRAHQAKVVVTIDGIAASIASVIAMAGDQIVMPENAMMMIHDPSGVVMGTAQDMRKLAEALDKIKGGLIAAYRSKSGMSDEDIADLMSDETWLTAKEAVDFGLADEMTESVKAAAMFDLSRFRKLPNQLAAMQASAAATQPLTQPPTTEQEADMDLKTLTIDVIENERPDLIASVKEQSFTSGFFEGQDNERERIKSVQEQSMPGHEELIAKLMYDGKTTGAMAAVQVLAAEKAKLAGKAAALSTDAAALNKVQNAPAPEDTADRSLSEMDDESMKAECTQRWERDATLRQEFGAFATYLAWARADAKGQIKSLGHRTAA